MIALSNPCARAELHQQKRTRKLCSATLRHEQTTLYLIIYFSLLSCSAKLEQILQYIKTLTD